MALALVRPYFRTRINLLSYTEWEDGFADDNIPDNILDNSYHIIHGTIVPRSRGNTDLVFNVPISVKAYFKGFRDPSAAIDLGLAGAEGIISSVVNPVNYSTGIKNVEFISLNVDPFDEVTNDNVVKATISFNVVVMICIN